MLYPLSYRGAGSRRTRKRSPAAEILATEEVVWRLRRWYWTGRGGPAGCQPTVDNGASGRYPMTGPQAVQLAATVNAQPVEPRRSTTQPRWSPWKPATDDVDVDHYAVYGSTGPAFGDTPSTLLGTAQVGSFTWLFPVPRECGFALMGVHAALRAALVRRIRAV